MLSKKSQRAIAMTLLSVTLATTSAQTVFAATNTKKSISIETNAKKLNISSETMEGDLNTFCTDLQKEFNKDVLSNSKKDSEIGIKSVGSKSVKLAAEWLQKNWTKVLSKAPSWLKPYLQASFLGEAIDAYIGISDTVEEFVYDVLRYMLPDFVSDWWVDKLTTTIMLLMPI